MSTVVLTCITTTLVQSGSDPAPGMWHFVMDAVQSAFKVEQMESGTQSTFQNVPVGTYACSCGRLDVNGDVIGDYAKMELTIKGDDRNVQVADKLTAQVFS